MRQVETESQVQDSRFDTPAVDTSTCETIPDADGHHCLVLALDRSEHCDAIGHADTKPLCRAQVTADASACASIQEAKQRQDCRGMFQ